MKTVKRNFEARLEKYVAIINWTLALGILFMLFLGIVRETIYLIFG